MIDLLIHNASELITCRANAQGATNNALQELDIIRDGALAIADDRIVEVGASTQLLEKYEATEYVDARGKLVSPGLIDAHSHLLYAGSRHEEWETLVTGRTDPGQKLGGGIRYTVSKTRAASADDLRRQALADLDVMLEHGTTTVEAKTGYGLDRETEMRMLHVQNTLDHPVDVVSTYLGAHVLPEEYRDQRKAYVDLVIEMLDQSRPLAEYCDVCCDPIGFTVDECERMIKAATALGYRIKLHADQTGYMGGAELAGRTRATSADHLDYISEAGIQTMAESGTVGVLLPSVTFHMMEMTPKVKGRQLVPAMKPFLPHLVRRMIESGMLLAISADYNPGSSPTPSMQMTMQAAARLFRLGYAEIWHMSTINAAHALNRAHDRGSLEPGKRADAIVWRIPEHGMVINRFGINMVDRVVKDGQVIVADGRRCIN